MTSLQIALRLNAASCLGFGVVFVAVPGPTAAFLGTMPETLVLPIGAVLVLNGLHLAWASTRVRPIWPEILWFSLGDMLWWLASLGLLALGIWITSPAGTVAAWGTALLVAGLGLWQMLEVGRARTGLPAKAHLARIGQSWLGLPLWVKVWLFGLNAVFLLAVAFIPSEMARVVLTGYVASGPLLAGIAFAQGGLSRLAGLGHLVPWLPMLIWLGTNPSTGPAAAYAAMVIACTGICLAFDVYDTARWLRGERAVIGLEAQ